MKKIFASAIFVAFFGLYALYQYQNNGASLSLAYSAPQQTAPVQTVAENATAPQSAPPSNDTQSSVQLTPTQAPVATPAPAPKPQGQYADGTYTGSAADAYYGSIQVEATISGGKLTDVAFLQYPNDRSTSRYINGQAMPVLKSQAITAQSANVDGVSGATDSSAAFRQSLSSALSQAKNS